MGFLDRAKKMAEKAGPLIDKAAPHARTAVDKAGQQIDKRTGGKYHDKIEQVEQKVGEYADKRMGGGDTGSAAASDGFPPTPPPADAAPRAPHTAPSTAATADSTPVDSTPAGSTPPDGTPADGTRGDGAPGDSGEASVPSGTATPSPPVDPGAPGDRPTL